MIVKKYIIEDKDKIIKCNWWKVYCNSFKYGWIDIWWGGHATWWWSIKRFLPWGSGYTNNKLRWALIKSCYHKNGWHYISSTGCCMMCEELRVCEDFTVVKEPIDQKGIVPFNQEVNSHPGRWIKIKEEYVNEKNKELVT